MKRKFDTLHLTALGVSTAVVMAVGSYAQAQGSRSCAPHAAVVEHLAQGYGETRQSIGLGANNAVVEVFASDETGTWSITVTAPGGLTCLVASGQSFENVTEVLPAEGNDV